MSLHEKYIELTNSVLVVNYWGEVLTVELLSRLLQRDAAYRYRKILARQLLDETRHANVTRELLLERGRDPVHSDNVSTFTYRKLFDEWATRSFEETLTFLGTNERISSRNFSSLIKVGTAAEDEQLVTLYSEVLSDEVTHSRNIFDALPDSAELSEAAALANAAMKASFSLSYGKLAQAYPAAFGWPTR